MNFPALLHRRPIFAGVISIVITLVGVIALSTLPNCQYSRAPALTSTNASEASGDRPRTKQHGR